MHARADLLDSDGASSRARETEQTANLDNRGLLQMQTRVMQSQDNELEELERTVASTRVSCPSLELWKKAPLPFQSRLRMPHSKIDMDL